MATKGIKQGIKEVKTGKSGSASHEKKETPAFKAQEVKGAKMAGKKKC